MKLRLSLFAVLVALTVTTTACLSNQKTVSQTAAPKTAAPEATPQTPLPEPTPRPAPTRGDLKDYWQHFGVSGRNFRDTKPGEFGGGEGGLISVKTFAGQMWSVNFEPLDRRDVPLDQRLVYMAQISTDSSEKVLCGAALPDFSTAPARCIVQEKILTWNQTKSFFRSQIKDHAENFAEIEKFLRRRSGESESDGVERDAKKISK